MRALRFAESDVVANAELLGSAIGGRGGSPTGASGREQPQRRGLLRRDLHAGVEISREKRRTIASAGCASDRHGRTTRRKLALLAEMTGEIHEFDTRVGGG